MRPDFSARVRYRAESMTITSPGLFVAGQQQIAATEPISTIVG